MNIEQTNEAIYTSLENANEDIDLHISNLRDAVKESGAKEAIFKPDRFSKNNHLDYKTVQAYFNRVRREGEF